MSDKQQAVSKSFTFYVLQYRFLAVALVIAFAAAWPLLADTGLLNTRGGGDSPFLLQRLQQMETAVLQGHFPARWMPDANYGYGYPFFNYYAPLSIYITLIFRLIGFSYVRSIQLSQLAGFLVAAWSMFILVRRWFKSDWAGLLAAAAYTLAPFHMVNIYVRGDSLAEFWAMAFYPLVILAADACRGARGQGGKGEKASLAWLALAYAGLILSHNISALIFSPFLLLYILLHTWPFKLHNSQFTIHYSLFALLLAFTLSAWFFVPALAEQSFAQLGPVTEGYFHFSNHFRGADLVQKGFFFDYNPDGGLAFSMGLVQTVTAVLGLIGLLIFKNKLPFRARLFIITSLLIATFMITPFSQLLWDNVPLLPFTQFPWRFLSVQAFAAALTTAGLAALPWRKWLVPVTAVLLLTAASLGNLKTDHLGLTDDDITGEKLAQYEWFTGNIGTTISAEYLPHTVQPRPYTSTWLTAGERNIVRALSGEITATQRMNERMMNQIWQVETAVPTTLIFPTLHWPGWIGEIDGEWVEIRPSPGSGLIMLDAPAGNHIIGLRLTRTPVRLAAELLSLAAFLLTIGMLIRNWKLETGDWKKLLNRQSLIASLVLIGLIILLRTRPEPVSTNSNLTWDFAQLGYLHHDNAIHFSNGTILTDYKFDREVVNAGETVAITLNWQDNVSTQATLALATPANLRNLEAAFLIEQTKPVQAGSVTYQLAIPKNAPPGLYVPRLLLDNGRPLTPSGQKRGDLYLRPLRILQSPIANLQPPVSNLEVLPINGQPRGNILDIQLAWWTATRLSHNYNVSLRLLDGEGTIFAQFDAQPGYGFLPSSNWPVNEWTNDWLTIKIPTLESAPYSLTATLYDVATGEIVLTRRLGTVNSALAFQKQEPVFSLPDEIMGKTAVFTKESTPIIQLAGWQKHPNGLTLYWESLAATPTNYTRFLHVTDPATSEISAQVDGYAMGDSYPTSQWQPSEVIADVIHLDWSSLPDDVTIWVGWYQNLDDPYPRLTAVAPNGSFYPDDRVLLETRD